MIPYQGASKEIRRQAEQPVKAAASILSAGAGVAGLSGATAAGASLMKSALPFLNKYIPEAMAIKGLSKLDPRFGKFIKSALDDGHDFEEIKSFIEEKGESELSGKEGKPKEDRNIIQQYSPELFQFIEQQVQGGRNALQAGAIAQNDNRFSGVIKKIMQDHKTPWSNILESVFGQQEQSAQPPQQMQSQQPGQQSGQGAQAIQQAMQRISQLIGQ